MKKPKLVKPFFFKNLTHQQMVDKLNQEYPVNIKYNERLVNRVYTRYPLINKSEVSFIIRAVFQSLRDLLVLGNVLNFNGLFFDTKLHFFVHRRENRTLPSLKVKISTPPSLRRYDKK